MADVSFVMIAFQADHTLEACLRSLFPFGQIICVEGPVQFWQEQGYVSSSDRTLDILRTYRIPTTSGVWREKDEMVREAMAMVKTPFVFFVDADEIWDAQTLGKIFTVLDGGNVDAMAFKPYSFYGGFDRYMTGFERDFAWHRVSRIGKFSTHRPPTLLAPDGRPWREHRYLNQFVTEKLELCFYHYSYVFPTQMKMKAEYYRDTQGGTIPDYFRQVYLPWVKGDAQARRAIEERYHGVHDWRPERRGDCYTAPFAGEHPYEVTIRLAEWKARFVQELEACV